MIPREPPRPLSRLAAMRGRTRISLLACLFALGLAGCGSNDGTIPENDAATLLALLDTMDNYVDSGTCEQVPSTAEEIADQVDGLPSDVDTEVRDALVSATARLDELAAKPGECEEVPAGTTDTGTVETTTSTTTAEETTSTTTDEETTTEDETTTQDETTSTESPSGSPGPSDEDLSPPTGDQGPSGGGDTGGGDTGGGAPPSGGVGAGGGSGAK